MIVVTFAVGIALTITSIVLLSLKMAEPSSSVDINTRANHSFQISFPIEKTSPENDPAIFARESVKRNEDVIGWIRIDGTSVDYPVVQATDDIYYLTHDASKQKSVRGAIFLEYRCDPVSLKGNNILYGHHMRDGSMFANLVKYKDEGFFKSHSIIKFASLERTYQWEVFAVLITDPSYDYLQTEFTDEAQYLSFITEMQKKSLFETDIKLSGTDDILILSTCSYEYDNARFVVAARKIL